MWSRRSVLAALGAAAISADAHARKPAPSAPPDLGEADEDFWREVQESFTLDRTLINLNNGGCCPSPRVVHEALKRYLDLSNQAPTYHMWQVLEPGVETVRRELAEEAGVDPEELAITRNASEALQTAQMGIELQPGDEVVTTDQDYPRMLDTWEQRVRRHGIVLTKVPIAVPATADQLADAVIGAFGPKTKAVHVSHVTFLTGQIFPVQRICAAARERGIVSIVDGAHAFAQFDTRIGEIGCDYYGTSLHKWLLAPVGTGFLHIRKERIARTWALQPTHPDRDGDVRKFEEIGTHPAANHHAIAEALAFHRGIGQARKTARLRYLRARWSDRLRKNGKIRLLTPDDPALSGAIGTFGIEGADPAKVTAWLWEKKRILATGIVHASYQGVRITPNVYTTLDEIDTFAAAIEELVG